MPLAAFGGLTADATSKLGQTADQVGNELYQRAIALQEFNEQVKADQASSDVFEKQTQRYLDFDKLKAAPLERDPFAIDRVLQPLERDPHAMTRVLRLVERDSSPTIAVVSRKAPVIPP